jgi:aminopeptidase
MVDQRIVKLSGNLVNYSCKVKPGDNVLIEATDIPQEFISQLVKDTYAAGGNPYVWLRDRRVTRNIIMYANEAHLANMAESDSALMKQMQCYIGVRGGDNSAEYSDVPSDKMTQYMRVYSHPVHSLIRVPQTRWVVLRYPSQGMAQQASMSTDAFEDYYFNVCCLDYKKMSQAMDPLVALMNRTDRVRLTAAGTDISFSTKGLSSIKCDGELNIPDGEVFTAPVKGSINGRITYNTPALYNGFTFENISFLFKDGKIVEATSNNNKLINEILDTDEGARYVGEFAIGVNPFITTAMKDTLFDEKITGSIHFTPGNCYDDCPNDNKSAIHWDLVLIQTPEYGGGEIWFDDVLVRKDGLFVLPELLALNPENLK